VFKTISFCQFFLFTDTTQKMVLAQLFNDSLQIIFTTSVLSYLFLGFLFFYVIGLFWALFANYAYPDELGSPMLDLAFSAVSIYVMYLVNKMIDKFSSGYVDPIIEYRTLLKKIEDWVDHIEAETKLESSHGEMDHFGIAGSFMLYHIYKIYGGQIKYDITNQLERKIVGIKDDSLLGIFCCHYKLTNYFL